jgi:hypothetical protein
MRVEREFANVPGNAAVGVPGNAAAHLLAHNQCDLGSANAAARANETNRNEALGVCPLPLRRRRLLLSDGPDLAVDGRIWHVVQDLRSVDG